MGTFVVEDLGKKEPVVLMDNHHKQHQQGTQSSAVTKIERRIVEKNRRNQMKVLFSRLNSLLPPENSKEALTLPDQVDEAINYIKSLEANVKKIKEKKKSLMGKKRSCSSTFQNDNVMGSLRSPKIEIHEMGSVLEIVLITGQDNQFIFYELIRILHEERADVTNAKYSVFGDSIFHVVHAEIVESIFSFGGTKISERVRRFVSGSCTDVESKADQWWDDFEIHPEMLEF
ncbi:transcription factor bHLH162-like [Humulus lupulus]|uniref:transcription factor bHLH162-like n=1 Tax=Humulus lupulus TaxID=3486 RepID=UPI002B40153A|nr:transcription factor bHLH162-like [Humulus lupulus]